MYHFFVFSALALPCNRGSFVAVLCEKARRNAPICLKAAHYTAVLSRFPEANC